MRTEPGWYRWRKSYWHWFDDDAWVSVCGALSMPNKKRVMYSPEKPKPNLTAPRTKGDRVCLACERMWR